MDFKTLAEKYKTELFENVVPFWLTHSQDKEYGGYFTCLLRDGTVFDTDKFIWLQGREVWFFSYLYNKVEKRQEWLDCAIQGGEFLKRFGHDGDYNWYFSLTREGRPLVAPYNIFSYTFAAMAFGQLALATGNKEYEEIAQKTYARILEKKDNPKGMWNKLIPGTRDLKNFALPMILCNLSLEIEHLLDEEVLKQTIEHCIHEVMDVFYMDLGVRLGRQDLIDRAVDIALKMVNVGWDKEFGGIFYFMDRLGYPTQQLEWDQKLWWVHIETMICMVKGYLLTGRPECWAWFEKVQDYAWSHFKDPVYPEWYGYLNRQGEVLLPLKGGKWKGCFHVPRGLYQCWQTLQKCAIKQGE